MNVCEDGVCFVAETTWQIGERVLLTLDDENGDSIQLPCQLRWHVSVGSGSMIGCQIPIEQGRQLTTKCTPPDEKNHKPSRRTSLAFLVTSAITMSVLIWWQGLFFLPSKTFWAEQAAELRQLFSSNEEIHAVPNVESSESR